jgi:hypothetical protein
MPTMYSVRCMAKAQTEGPGPSEWLKLVWESNKVVPGTFGTPTSTGPWWAGGEVEEYEDARIIHRGDGTVSVVSKTLVGALVLRLASAALDMQANPTVESVEVTPFTAY